MIFCILFTACSTIENPDQADDAPKGFKGIMDSGSTDVLVQWSKGDRISINGNAYYTSFHDDVSETLFVCSGDEAVPHDNSPLYEAFYPHTLAYMDEWNGISLALPVNQPFTEPEAICIPMYASSDTQELEFNFLTGVLGLKLLIQKDSLAIRRISLKSSDALSGRFSISDGKAVMEGKVGSTRMTIDRTIHTSSPLDICFNVPEGTYTDLCICIEAENGADISYPTETVLNILAGRKTDMTIKINPDEYVPANCLYYKSTDGKAIIPFDMEPVSNVYKDGIGIMTFATTLTTIKSNAFRNVEGFCTDGARLTEIRLPKSVKSIGNYAFENCSALKEFIFPVNDQYTSVAASIFCGCTSLEYIFIPDNVTKINNNAFMNCSSLKEIRLPEHIDKIPQNTFNGCSSLKTINIPKSLTVIGVKAFMGTALEEFEIPAAVTVLESQTFQDCTSLKTLKVNRLEADNSITAMNSSNVLKNCTSLQTILVPQAGVDIYSNAENWSNHKQIIKGF